MMLKYVLLWLPMVALAIINGAVRDLTYARRIREQRAHQLSTFTGILLFGIYIWWILSIWPADSPGEAVSIGITWLGLTLAFEFLFGHYIAGHQWRRLLHDYNVLAGRVWVLVPLWVAVAPYLFTRMGSAARP